MFTVWRIIIRVYQFRSRISLFIMQIKWSVMFYNILFILQFVWCTSICVSFLNSPSWSHWSSTASWQQHQQWGCERTEQWATSESFCPTHPSMTSLLSLCPRGQHWSRTSSWKSESSVFESALPKLFLMTWFSCQIKLKSTQMEWMSDIPLHRYKHQLWWADVLAQHRSITFSISCLHVDWLCLLIGPEQVSTQPVTG